MGIRKLLCGAVIATLTAFGGSQVSADQFVSIGTGGVTGVYYPTGGAICRLVNKDPKIPWHSLLSRINWRLCL